MEHQPTNAQNTTDIKVKDHFKSGEEFTLEPHPEHGYLMTMPMPTAERLPYYYDSQEYISHTDSNKGLLAKCYQWAKQIALKRKRKLIAGYKGTAGKLLDVGAGTGDFLKFMKDAGWSVLGTEPNKLARGLAAKKDLQLYDALDKLPEEKFDVISLWHVLEHIPDLEATISTLRSKLDDAGVLIVAVPNHESLDAKHYGAFWAAYDVPRHLWHFDRSSMESLMRAKFELKEVHPMTMDSYYVSLLSEKYKGGSLGIFKAAYWGWRSNLKARKSGDYSSLIYVFSPK